LEQQIAEVFTVYTLLGYINIVWFLQNLRSLRTNYKLLCEEVNIPSSSFDEDVNDRTLRLVLVLNFAQSLRNLRNFHLLFAVLGRLNQPALDWIWTFVKEKQTLWFQTPWQEDSA